MKILMSWSRISKNLHNLGADIYLVKYNRFFKQNCLSGDSEQLWLVLVPQSPIYGGRKKIVGRKEDFCSEIWFRCHKLTTRVVIWYWSTASGKCLYMTVLLCCCLVVTLAYQKYSSLYCHLVPDFSKLNSIQFPCLVNIMLVLTVHSIIVPHQTPVLPACHKFYPSLAFSTLTMCDYTVTLSLNIFWAVNLSSVF